MIARLAILADRELKRQEVAQLVREEMLAKYEAIELVSGVGSFPEQRCCCIPMLQNLRKPDSVLY